MQKQFDSLVSIIKLIAEDNIVKNRFLIDCLGDPSLKKSLTIIIERSSKSLKHQDATKSLSKKLKQKEEQIDKLYLKINNKQFSNRKNVISEGDNIKLMILGLIQSSTLSQALQISQKYKLQISKPISQLLEYRSLKKIKKLKKNIQETTSKKSQHQWSHEGQQLKKLVEKQSQLVRLVNRRFCQMIQNFFNNDKSTFQNISSEYISSQTHELLSQLRCYTQNFKQRAWQIAEQESKFLNSTLKVLKEMGSDIVKQYKPTCDIYWLCEALIQRVKKQGSEFQEYLKSLIQIINQAIVQFKTVDIADNKIVFHSQNPKKSLKEILEFIKKILSIIWGKQQLIACNKQILSQLSDQQYILKDTIIQIAQKLGLNHLTRNQINSLDDTSTIASSIKTKIKQIIDQNQQNQRKLTSQKGTNDEVDSLVSQDFDLTRKKIKTVQNSAEENINENIILKKQLQQLKRKHKEIKEQQQQQVEISHRHKQTSIILQRKLKTMQAPQSSIYLANSFGEDKFMQLALLEENAKIKNQKLILEKQIQDKNTMISNFEHIKANIAFQKEKEKQKEILKLKDAIRALKKDLNDSYQQIRQLYEILQEKNQLIKSNSQIVSAFSEKNLSSYKKQQNQVAQDQKVELNNIHEAYHVQLKKQAEMRQIQSEKLIKKQNQLILQIQNLEDSSLKLQKEFSQQKIKILKRHKQEIESLSSQLQQWKQKSKANQIGQITNIPINLESNHLFAFGSSIFNQEDCHQRLYLLQTLRHYTYKIKKTRLLYRLDQYNKVSFHKYVDHHSHVVVIIKTLIGKFIAGFYQKPLVPSRMEQGFGMIMSLWNKRTYLVKDKRAITYDDYFIIFGNSQIRLKNLQYKVFSNFGISNSYYNTKGQKIDNFLGEENNREVDIVGFQIYSLQFDL